MTFGDPSYPSICLPFVHKSVNRKQINAVIAEHGLGVVDRIDIASKKHSSKPFNIVFVHFKQWADTPEVNLLRTNLHSNKDPKHYEKMFFDDDGHYWKFTKSHVDRPERDVKSKKDSISIESIDALLHKEFAALAAVQKRIADLQSKRSSLLLRIAADAVSTTHFPTDSSSKKKVKKTKKTKVVRPILKPIRAPVSPPTSPPMSPVHGASTPTFPPPFPMEHESPSWGDVAEAEE